MIEEVAPQVGVGRSMFQHVHSILVILYRRRGLICVEARTDLDQPRIVRAVCLRQLLLIPRAHGCVEPKRKGRHLLRPG